MKRFSGRTVAKIYSVTAALTALAAFVVYSQQKANTNSIHSTKVMVLPGSKDAILVQPVGSNTNAPAPLLLSGTKSFVGVVTPTTGSLFTLSGNNGTNQVGTLTVSGDSNQPAPHIFGSKSGFVFEPAQKIIPSSKSGAVFTPPATNAPRHIPGSKSSLVFEPDDVSSSNLQQRIAPTPQK